MSNFKCDKCGTTLIDCGLGIFKTPREIELEERLKILDEEAIVYEITEQEFEEYKNMKARVKELEEKLNAQFIEMEEKVTEEGMKNFFLIEKLKIAEEALFMIGHISYSGSGKEVEGYYRGIANKALQKMKEVK